MQNTIQNLLEEIYADSKVTPSEILKFRKKISDISAELTKVEGNQGILDALCKSIDVSIQLLQETLLNLKRGQYNPKSKESIELLLEAYIALLKLNFDAFK